MRGRFKYLGVLDPSWFFAEPIQRSEAIVLVSRVVIGTETVPYVPKMYSSKDPPTHVNIRILLYCNLVLSDTNSFVNFVAAGCGCM
jgi:hypothetical protein